MFLLGVRASRRIGAGAHSILQLLSLQVPPPTPREWAANPIGQRGDSKSMSNPTGNGGRKTPTGGSTGRNRNAFCSFCRKSYRDVGPLVEGPGDVYICGECVELCQSIIDQERKRRGISRTTVTNIPSPRSIKETVD